MEELIYAGKIVIGIVIGLASVIGIILNTDWLDKHSKIATLLLSYFIVAICPAIWGLFSDLPYLFILRHIIGPPMPALIFSIAIFFYPFKWLNTHRTKHLSDNDWQIALIVISIFICFGILLDLFGYIFPFGGG